ncbi:hypothetical protein XENOCAPTIV_002277, partial [Xenoophorus captivus]
TGKLSEFLTTSCCAHLSFLDGKGSGSMGRHGNHYDDDDGDGYVHEFRCDDVTLLIVCVLRGMEWDTQLRGKGSTVSSLLSELYEKAGDLKHWGLIRMISGMLKKKVEELDSVWRDRVAM